MDRSLLGWLLDQEQGASEQRGTESDPDQPAEEQGKCFVFRQGEGYVSGERGPQEGTSTHPVAQGRQEEKGWRPTGKPNPPDPPPTPPTSPGSGTGGAGDRK
jgi:hypothetical protein